MNKPLAFATQSVNLGGWSAERAVNYYPRTFPQGTASGTVMLRQHAGLTQWVDIATRLGTESPVRCMIEHQGDLYAFCGGVIWRIKWDGSFTDLIYPIPPSGSGLADDAGATMASDGLAIGIVANGRYGVVTVTGPSTASVTYPTLPEIVTPKSVSYLNHRMIVTGIGSGRGDVIAVSDPLDATTFQSTAFGSAEADPDRLVQGYTVGDTFYALGSRTIEPFYDSGSGNFPLTPYGGATIPHGLLSRRAVSSDGYFLYFVSRDARVFRARAGQAQEISHPGVAKALSTKNNARCFMMHDGETTFFVVSVAGSPAWCFDLKEMRWSERYSGTDFGRFLGRCSEQFEIDTASAIQTLIGGNDGVIYILDPDAYADGSNVLHRWVVSQPIMQRDFTVDYLEIQMETGSADIGRTPQGTLYRSKNGREFSVLSQRSLGEVGDLDREVYWNGLGHFPRKAQFAFEVTDPVRADVFGVDMDAR